MKEKKEYLFCIQKNLNLKYIDNVFIFLNKNIDRDDLLNLKNSEKFNSFMLRIGLIFVMLSIFV